MDTLKQNCDKKLELTVESVPTKFIYLILPHIAEVQYLVHYLYLREKSSWFYMIACKFL